MENEQDNLYMTHFSETSILIMNKDVSKETYENKMKCKQQTNTLNNLLNDDNEEDIVYA